MPTRAALLFALACAAACGGPAPTPKASTTFPSAGPGRAARGFRRVLNSRTIDGDALSQRQSPATIAVFFASWCGVCQHELAILAELRDAYPELRIIGLNAYEEYRNLSDKARLRRYLQRNAPWLTEIVHADAELLSEFGGVPKIPTLFVYDHAGQPVAEFRRGQRPPPTPAELEDAILQALGC